MTMASNVQGRRYVGGQRKGQGKQVPAITVSLYLQLQRLALAVQRVAARDLSFFLNLGDHISALVFLPAFPLGLRLWVSALLVSS